MIKNSGFKASDAERQTADSASNYLSRSLRLLAERLELEKSLERDPAAFAVQFAPLVAALIEVQAREYQSMVLNSLDWSLLSGLSDLAERWQDQNLFQFRQTLSLPAEVAERLERAAGDGE